MEPNLEDVWEQALIAETRYGAEAVAMITVRMIERLKMKDYVEAGFWSAVANRLTDLQAIKTNFSPISSNEENSDFASRDGDDSGAAASEIGLHISR